MREEWLQIEGTDGLYDVSNLGRVRSWSNFQPGGRASEPRLRKTPLNVGGYPIVVLKYPDKLRTRMVHRLVLETFVGPPGPGEECRHLDGDRTNNELSNLAWGTCKQNAADRVEHGTALRGEKCPWAKLRRADVLAIRERYAAGGISQAALAKSFGVSTMLINRIVRRKVWAHVPEKPDAL